MFNLSKENTGWKGTSSFPGWRKKSFNVKDSVLVISVT